MEAKVIRWGDDLAVRLSAEAVEQLGLSEGQTVEVRAKDSLGGNLPVEGTVSPGRRRSADGIPVYTLEEMVAEARRLGPDFEPPTVDWGPDRGSEIIDDDDPR